MNMTRSGGYEKEEKKKHTRTHHITFSSWSTLVFKFFFSLSHFYLPKLKHPYKLSPQALEKKTLSDECMHVFIFFTVWSLTFLNHRRWWMEILINTNGKGQKMKKSHNCFFFGLGKYKLLLLWMKKVFYCAIFRYIEK